MLQQLHISNYALIDQITVDFHAGLTAITGETGSGKSILLGALGLLLGERADSRKIKNPEAKCIVEASFALGEYQLHSFFSQHDLDYDDLTTIRREIAPGGKNRCFINDTPVSIQTLKHLGEGLVDIHSQHQNSILGERSFQFSIIDSFAKNQSLPSAYKSAFKKYKDYVHQLNTCIEEEERAQKEMDYLMFQQKELKNAALDHVDISAWEQELETLEHAGEIKQVVQQITSQIDDDTQGIIQRLSSAKQSLHKISSFNRQLSDFSERLESCLIELKELNREMDVFGNDIQMNPQRLEQLNEALGKIYHLQQKHHVISIEELRDITVQIEEKINNYKGLGEKVSSLRVLLQQAESNMRDTAAALTQVRQEAALSVQQEVAGYFSALHLDHAALKIEITPSDTFHSFGKDDIQFLFKANKGGTFLPIQLSASGGEISRVMLAIKASVSRHKKLPVLILDEIDQGVSGEAGKKIGAILKEMSIQMQVIAITHLPQIAGKADHHLKISKVTHPHSTSTSVKELIEEERITELAEMLNGKDYTSAALQNARELLQ